MNDLMSLGDLAKEFAKNTLKVMAASEAGLAKAAEVVQLDAKERIGHYQRETGPFPEWAPLAESTEAQKAALGYPTGAPLLRTGDLRDSIVTEHSATEAVIGSKMPVAAYQEFGTSRIPPRPFLGPAVFSNKARIERIIGGFASAALVGKDAVHDSLGYGGASSKKNGVQD